MLTSHVQTYKHPKKPKKPKKKPKKNQKTKKPKRINNLFLKNSPWKQLNLKLEFPISFLPLTLMKGEDSTQVKEPNHKDEREQQRPTTTRSQWATTGQNVLEGISKKHNNEE